jgi:hypothetical protein
MDIFASIDGAFFYERYGSGFLRRQNRETVVARVIGVWVTRGLQSIRRVA